MKQIFKDTLTIVIASAVIIGGYAIYDNLPHKHINTRTSQNKIYTPVPKNRTDVKKVQIQTPKNLTADISALPNIPGAGNLPDLRTAMAEDVSGNLKALVKSMQSEKNPLIRRKLVNDIIFHWSGVQNINPQSRKPEGFKHNPLGDARILLVLEKFLGEKYHNIHREGEEANKPRGKNEIFYLHKAYNDFYIFVESTLNMQTVLDPYLKGISLHWNNETKKWHADCSKTIEELRNLDDSDYQIYLLETLETSNRSNKFFNKEVFESCRSLAKPDSKDAFEIYLKDFGRHSHTYRFQVKENKSPKKQKK